MKEPLKTIYDIGDPFQAMNEMESWPDEKIELLANQTDEWYDAALKDINDKWGKTALEPSYFLSRTASLRLDEAKHKAEMSVLSVASLIHSVIEWTKSQRAGRETGQ